MPFRDMNAVQLDALREISTIGMGHAATALSQILDQRIDLRVPKVSVTAIDTVPEQLGGAESLMVGITLQILGDARGSIMLLFPQESACRLLSCLLHREERALVMSELNVSALKEVGNILASAYLSAIGNLLHKTLIPSVPLLAYDMAGAVVDYVLIDLSKGGDVALMIETDFIATNGRDQSIRGHFFILPDPRTLEVFLATLKERA
jgi:chemotaxis protein CheC